MIDYTIENRSFNIGYCSVNDMFDVQINRTLNTAMYTQMFDCINDQTTQHMPL